MDSTISSSEPRAAPIISTDGAEARQSSKHQPWKDFVHITPIKGKVFMFDVDHGHEGFKDHNIRLLAELDDKGAGG